MADNQTVPSVPSPADLGDLEAVAGRLGNQLFDRWEAHLRDRGADSRRWSELTFATPDGTPVRISWFGFRSMMGPGNAFAGWFRDARLSYGGVALFAGSHATHADGHGRFAALAGGPLVGRHRKQRYADALSAFVSRYADVERALDDTIAGLDAVRAAQRAARRQEREATVTGRVVNAAEGFVRGL